jgi:hypothetical protein
MIIEDNLLVATNIIFKKSDRKLFKHLSDSQKSKYSFIINRYLSKEYPELSELLNDKNSEGCGVYDIWWNYFSDKNIPRNFWSKSDKLDNKSESKISKPQRDWLMTINNLNKESDLDFLIKNHPDLIKDELKRWKKG